MTRRPSLCLAVGLMALLAPAGLLAACGGSDDASSSVASTADTADVGGTADTVVGSDSTAIDLDAITIPDISIPTGAGISEECAVVYQKFLAALGSASTGQDFEGLTNAISSLDAVVPDDLTDDVQILSQAYGELAEVIADFDGDFAAAMADPATQQRMTAIGTPEVSAAGDAISAYFDQACPGTDG